MSEPLEEEYGLEEFLIGDVNGRECDRIKQEWAESLVESHGYDKNSIGEVRAVVTLKVYPKPEYKKEDLL